MVREPSGRPGRRSLPHWLLEGVFIVVSVALGFAVGQYGERRSERALADRVLASVLAEVERNRASLRPLVPVHAAWVYALARSDAARRGGSAFDIYFAARPPLPPDAASPFPSLRRSAWDAAVAGGALRLIDYGVAEALSEIYRMQEIATENVGRLAGGALSTPATFDPARTEASVRMLWLTMADIHSAEAVLLAQYERHLPALRRAAGAR